MEKDKNSFDHLVEVMKRLRSPGGCPWDRKQTYETLCPHIVEEAYELVDAIERRGEDRGIEHVLEECGDLLLQVVFIGTIAEEQGDFSVSAISDVLSRKLIRRHPHVFGDTVAADADAVLENWEKIKREERAEQPQKDTSVLSGVPRSLPATVKAYRIQQKAAMVGFDWEKDSQQPVIDKISEELREVCDVIDSDDKEAVTGEIGDLLFAVINLSRRLGIDPDVALSRTNAKFENRFRFVEKNVEENGGDWSKFTLEELDSYWNQAKNAAL